jgi:3-hydroxyisobutyrate dehydrogenase-like beta-hydroxyacid dehydrogenase
MAEKSQVTVLGLGAMGTALAEALLAQNYPTTVWNRSPKSAPAGAVVAATAAEAVAASRLVIICLLDDKSVLEVLGSVDELAGRVLVNLTNGTPQQARDLAELLADRDADLLDGGIMAVPPMIGQPGAFLFYSGSRSAFDTYRPVLDTFGESHYVGTDPGLAALYDISLLSGMYGMFMGATHAFAMIGSAGVPAKALAPLLTQWVIAMTTGFIGATAEQIDQGDYTLNVVSNLAMQAAAYPNLIRAAEEQGVSAELLVPLQRLLDRRVADGHGHENLAGVVELLKKAGK